MPYLARHPGWVFSASQIYEAVWDRDGEHCGTAVASAVSYTHLDVYKRQKQRIYRRKEDMATELMAMFQEELRVYPCLLYTSRCV